MCAGVPFRAIDLFWTARSNAGSRADLGLSCGTGDSISRLGWGLPLRRNDVRSVRLIP